ncbi:phage tail family protein [Streptomyces sp. JH14]|uniref:phage tail domain-containing protein n=1 Tax=Streptomyces sp. JH14 TaxID=2793630 RepID=UPI0023FA2188|nr:phage tail domain-containing protein [Streptomyces sp. JH14]MDF6043258.1 phage tail family protein [Streptomyces sp. JH14]
MPYTSGDTLGGGLRVDLGDIPLGGVDSAGVAWHLQEMDGWDSPASEGETQAREGDHGSWFTPVYLRERPITAAGTIVAPDRASLDDAMDRLRVAVSLTDTLLVVQESTPKQAMVRRSGKLLIKHVTDSVATYSLMVTAADPRRYSTDLQEASTPLPSSTGGATPPLTPPVLVDAVTVAGQIDAYNAGTFDSRPILVIDGPVIAPQVLAQMPDGSVRIIGYSQTLNVGEQLVIDTDAHSVILNGAVSRRRFLTTPTGWPIIPAGGTVSFQFRSDTYDPDAMLTARWRSAWM